jgi:hypothetical protein
MKGLRYFVIASAIFAALPAHAQITAFKHIVIIVQENRTPDSLFLELCNQPPALCNDTGDDTHYDIKTTEWDNQGNLIPPTAVDLAIGWDMEHHHDPDWLAMCHLNQDGNACQMDGAANEVCENRGSQCPNDYPPAFSYVQRYNTGNPPMDVLGPYISLALTYGWANKMFQTNQGPSFPAHQFIYGGTSAPSAADDGSGTYAAENVANSKPDGCVSVPGSNVKLIIKGVENESYYQYPCFQHPTLGTALSASPQPWRYYTPTGQSLWTAPNAILSECGGSNQNGNYPACTGPEFNGGDDANVVTKPERSCRISPIATFSR